VIYIEDALLRAWAVEHIEKATAERRANKAGWGDLEEMWSDWSEEDWAAFKELCFWRDKYRRRGISRGTVEIAVQRRMKRQPPLSKHGQPYDSPYSFGLEIACIQEMLENAVPQSVTGNDAWNLLREGR
jgi:hypothetical protein